MAKKKNKNNNQSNTNSNAVDANNNSNSNSNSNENEGEKKGGDGGEKKKEINRNTVVLKVEMHCDGCISKIVKSVRSFPGVETVRAEPSANKLTVIGFVDPLKIQEFVHQKTKKKVELISPQPKKEDANKNKNNNNDNKNNKKEDNKNNDKNQKPKEAPVVTAVLKLGLHCQGCIDKIHKTIHKTKGVHEMSIDRQKELVTVKGTMDVKALTEALKQRLKRPVDIVPPKKEKDGSDENAGGGGGGGKKKGGSGGDGGKDKAIGDGDGAVAKLEENRMEFMMQPGYGPGYGYMDHPMYVNGYPARPVYPSYGPDYGYGYGYGHPAPAYYPDHLQFNDENPNACSMM